MLFAGLGFAACEEDDPIDLNTPILQFAQTVYSLPPTESLEVKLTVSQPAPQEMTVAFDVSGAAIEGEEYELSAHEFQFAAGDTAASVIISPKTCKEDGKTIKLTLHPVDGYRFGDFDFALVELVAEAQVIASFNQSSYVLPQELTVTAYIKNALTGNYYSSHASEIKVPFYIDGRSTAMEGEHFEFVDNPDHVFSFGSNQYQSDLTIRLLKWEEGKTDLYLNVGDENIIAGNIDQIYVLVKGPTTVADLEGKWAFSEALSWDYLYENGLMWGEMDAGLANLPRNNTPDDILEFKDGRLIPHLTGDLSMYFRECDVTFLQEKQVFLNEQATGMRPPEVTVSEMQLGAANVNFSATHEDIRPARIGFRILEDNETLEVSIYDYEPTDFLYDTYNMVKDWTSEGMCPMDENLLHIRYHFKRVE